MSNKKQDFRRNIQKIRGLIDHEHFPGHWITRLDSGELVVINNDTVISWMLLRYGKDKAGQVLRSGYIDWNKHIPEPDESFFHNAVSVIAGSGIKEAVKIAYENGHKFFALQLQDRGIV